MILNDKNKEYILIIIHLLYIYYFLKKIYSNFKCIKTNLINKNKFGLIIIITQGG